MRIYLYRTSELLANPKINDTITNVNIVINDITDFSKYQNFIILMCFVASLVYTLLFHGGKLWFLLTTEKRSMILGTIVIFKTLLLTFDILTNGLLFYKVLVFKGLQLFNVQGLIAMTISVAAPSPIITLSTNGTTSFLKYNIMINLLSNQGWSIYLCTFIILRCASKTPD